MVVALMIPALLFYKWWTKIDAGKNELILESPAQAASLKPFFKADEEPLPSPSGYKTSVSTRALQAPRAADDPAAVPVVSQKQPSDVPAKNAVSLSKVAVSTAASVVFAPKINRDPTLSPDDAEKIKEREEEAERSRMLKESARRSVRPAKREQRIEDIISLQGIVETARGNKAIINGDMKNEGSVVRGAKIIRINPASVLFEYQGRRFTRKIPQ